MNDLTMRSSGSARRHSMDDSRTIPLVDTDPAAMRELARREAEGAVVDPQTTASAEAPETEKKPRPAT
jgi:hypothetical protein